MKKVTDFGAFVEFLPGKEDWVHVSQLDVKRVENPSDVVKVGDVFDVKIVDKDDQGGGSSAARPCSPPIGGTNVLHREGKAGDDLMATARTAATEATAVTRAGIRNRGVELLLGKTKKPRRTMLFFVALHFMQTK